MRKTGSVEGLDVVAVLALRRDAIAGHHPNGVGGHGERFCGGSISGAECKSHDRKGASDETDDAVEKRMDERCVRGHFAM